MSIPESILKAWAHQGSMATSGEVYKFINGTINSYTYGPSKIKPNVYIQGSYRNGTNIWSESDIDIIVEVKEIFQQDLSFLPAEQQALKQGNSPTSNYDYFSFKQDVLNVLTKHFGSSNIEIGNKSIKVKTISKKFPADVVPCFLHRRYLRYVGESDQRYIEGISFYLNHEGRWVTNFPNQHYSNGFDKDGNFFSRTQGSYKPVVRLFKNLRTRLVENEAISSKLAPSYFLECLLFNVPDQYFRGSFETIFLNIHNWFANVDATKFVCQNNLRYLFGNDRDSWDLSEARELFQKLGLFWNDWGKY